MKIFPVIFFVFALVFSIGASPTFAGDAPPEWLTQAASMPVPNYAGDVPAVVLRDEQQVTLGSDGKLVTVTNYAVRFLLREGRGFAVADALYLVDSGKVTNIEGWLMRPGASYKYYGKKDVIDRISDPDDVYNEYRVKIIDATGDADAGFIFGYTVTSEDAPLFYQDAWAFQGRLPTLYSHYALNLPAGWKAASKTLNHEEVAPQINGSSYSWELRNLAPIPPEPLSPSVRNIAPRVFVSYMPENPSQAVGKVFSDWTQVSQWASGVYDPQVVIDDAVAAKVQELTAGKKTELEKIRAIGNYVQNLQYISIDIGVGHGNGYRPRPSNVVLNRGYGDCKDKANLMRAMLKVLKIEAYPIAIYSGDPTYVRAEWASPDQFNHCIIAVKVSDETDAPTVIKDEKLGRLMIFDATDPYTSVGDLPNYLQGSNALIIAGANGGLIKMPTTPPETDLTERKIEVNLTADGSIKGKINERTSGQESTMSRAQLRMLAAADYRKMLEGWLARGATAAQLINFTPNDKKADASFDLDVEFSVPAYGQLMQNRLLVFKPVIVSRRNALDLTAAKRAHPVMLDAFALRETVTFNLPAGFIVDETPDAVDLATAFGKYKTSYEVADGKLIFKRELVMNHAVVPVEKYAAVKDFYAKMREVEQSPVVLLRK